VKVEISRLEAWRDRGIHGLEEAMKEREGDPVQAQLDEVNRRLGELIMENELLRIKASRAPGFPSGRLERWKPWNVRHSRPNNLRWPAGHPGRHPKSHEPGLS
jgi:hypothetical protein